ncbi:MAG: hypothetical protein Q9222_004929 [Ikaeria aurantiellina]
MSIRHALENLENLLAAKASLETHPFFMRSYSSTAQDFRSVLQDAVRSLTVSYERVGIDVPVTLLERTTKIRAQLLGHDICEFQAGSYGEESVGRSDGSGGEEAE